MPIVYGPKFSADPSADYSWFVHTDKPPRATTYRKKPVGISILSSPTAYSCFTLRVVNGEKREFGVRLRHPYSATLSANQYPAKELSALTQQATIKLLNKIKGEKWNLGTFLGELPETQKYMRSAVKEVVSLYSSLKKGNMKSIKRLAKRGRAYLKKRGIRKVVFETSSKASSRWMEWRYAISPIVYDLDDMLSYLHRSSTRPLISRVAAGSRGNHSEISKLLYKESFGVKQYAHFATVQKVQVRAMCYFSVHPKAEAFKQLGLINLGAILWELTPLSFVADWFLPVGDFIGHLDALAGVDVLSSTSSTRLDAVKSMAGFGFSYTRPSDGIVFEDYRLDPLFGEIRSYNRRLLNLSNPKFNFGTSPAGKQLIDMVALSRLLLFKNK